MNLNYRLLVAALLMTSANLSAEIESVKIVWNQGICTSSCVKDLHKHLGKVKGVTEVTVTSTQADLKWDPKTPFSFSAVDAGMRFVGVRLRQVFVSVSGTLSHDDHSVYIHSSGDGTRFTLAGPIKVTPGQASIRGNTESYPLSEAQRNDLLEMQEENKTVTVKGPMLLPYASPPMIIIIEQLSVKEPEKET